MLGWFRSRDSICSAVFFFYLLPLIGITAYSISSPLNKTWGVFAIGLFFLVTGTLTIYLLLAKWEHHLMQKVLVPAAETAVEQPEQPVQEPLSFNFHQEELETKNAEMQNLILAHDEYREEMNQKIENLNRENQSLLEQLAHKEHLLEMSEQGLSELRGTQERKQQRITQLETKVRDLSYEIKTLLQLTEIPDANTLDKTVSPIKDIAQPYQVDTKKPIRSQEKSIVSQEEACSQLKRCIDIAQKMTGASHYSMGNSRFRGIPVDNFALDLRCLFDSLRTENSCTILFYSPKENKLLFANNQTRELTGWSPEKFVQNFDHIVQEGKEEWNAAIKMLSSQSETKVRLILKARSGEDALVHGLLGSIPTGIFRHHIIAILYSADHRQALSNQS